MTKQNLMLEPIEIIMKYKWVFSPRGDFSWSLIMRPVVARGHMAVNVTGRGFDFHSRKRNILYIHFFILVSRQNAALS